MLISNATGAAKSKRINRLLLFGLPAVLLLASCNRGADGASSTAAAQSAQPTQGASPGAGGGRGRGGRGDGGGSVPVTTALVEERALATFVQGVGNVEALSTVEIRPQVTGPLLSVNFTEGQDVEKGQLLFTIDPRPFDLGVKQAAAQLAQDIGQSKTLKTHVPR